MAAPLPPRAPGSVLVLGGTSFMGRTTIEHLLSAGHAVTMVNRGRPYWGTDDPFGGRVRRLKSDRSKPKEFAKDIQRATKELLDSKGTPWLAVVDFSAYTPKDIEGALNGLHMEGGAVGCVTYVYVSTDSVYEVSRPPPPGVCVCEEHAVRPESERDQKRLNRKDSYGHKKLQVEERLARWASEVDRPVVALRLADVLGPWDETLRLWAYVWWLQCGAECPVHLPLCDSQQLNFTSSTDVARAVVACLEGSVAPLAAAQGGRGQLLPYNLACEEAMLLSDFLKLMAETLAELSRDPLCCVKAAVGHSGGIAGAFPSTETVGRGRVSLLPSVEREAPLDMGRAKADLPQDTLSTLRECVSDAVRFCCVAVWQHPAEAANTVRKLPAPARKRCAQLVRTAIDGLERGAAAQGLTVLSAAGGDQTAVAGGLRELLGLLTRRDGSSSSSSSSSESSSSDSSEDCC